MIIVTGCKVNGGYKMHSPKFPYNSTTYYGYTEEEMKKKFRQDNDLKGKHIVWVLI